MSESQSESRVEPAHQAPPTSQIPPASQIPPVPQAHGPVARVATVAHQAFDPRHKSPILASILSLMPGLGQVYVGYYQRGFAHAMTVATSIALLSADVLDEMTPFVAIFLVFFMLYNLVDAGRRAAFYNQALAEGESFEPMNLPVDAGGFGPQGNLVGGVMLLAVGTVLLLHTRFDVTLDWIEDWWPLAPMVVGGYMLVLAYQERRAMVEAEM